MPIQKILQSLPPKEVQTERGTNRKSYKPKEVQTERGTKRKRYKAKEVQTERSTNRKRYKPKEVQTERVTNRKKYKPKEVQTERSTNRKKYKPKEVQTERSTNRKRYKPKEVQTERSTNLSLWKATKSYRRRRGINPLKSNHRIVCTCMATFISRPLHPRTDPPPVVILWLEGCGDLDIFRLSANIHLSYYRPGRPEWSCDTSVMSVNLHTRFHSNSSI